MGDFLNSAFSWIFDSLLELFTQLYILFIALVDWLVEAVSSALSYIYEWLRDACFTILDPVLSYIDSSPFGSFDFLPTDLFSYLNFFFPLSEMIVVASVLFSFWLMILSVKILLKAIPTIY